MNTLQERVQQAVQEDVGILPYDSCWPDMFRREAEHLHSCIPAGLIRRIEHFGSTAVPGLAAKPIVDMLVQVTSLRAARTEIAPILKAQGYDYFWRPSFGEDIPPWYAFFIRRDQRGIRTHHIHMVTGRRTFQAHWERLLGTCSKGTAPSNRRAAFGQRTDGRGVAEHFRQRHLGVENGLAVLGFDADDLAATAVDVAEQIALIFVGRGAFHLHDRFEQDRAGLLEGVFQARKCRPS
jgi:GrpB-like predicted nucleotidyltransferase (UPF0157 family)